jgi:hypothetical protein
VQRPSCEVKYMTDVSYRLLVDTNEGVLKTYRLSYELDDKLRADIVRHAISKIPLRLSLVCANRR